MIKVVGYSILVIACILSAELTCRLFWGFQVPGAFFHPDRIIYFYQRNLLRSGLPEADVRRDDGYFDVLLLGGSVVSHDFGRIDDYLAAGLTDSKGPVRIWNAAEPAHTSRDSWEKYSRLEDKHFDLVIVYDGINDSRFNNIEPGQFRPDYSHVSWYREINAYRNHPEIAYFALPFTLERMLINLEKGLGLIAGRSDGGDLPNASNRPTDTRDYLLALHPAHRRYGAGTRRTCRAGHVCSLLTARHGRVAEDSDLGLPENDRAGRSGPQRRPAQDRQQRIQRHPHRDGRRD